MTSTTQFKVAEAWVQRGRGIPEGEVPLGLFKTQIYSRVNHLQRLAPANAVHLLLILKMLYPEFYSQFKKDVRFISSKAKPVGGYKSKSQEWAKRWAAWYHPRAIDLLLPTETHPLSLRENFLILFSQRQAKVRLLQALRSTNPVLYELTRSLSQQTLVAMAMEINPNSTARLSPAQFAKVWNVHFMMMEHTHPLVPPRHFFPPLHNAIFRVTSGEGSASTQEQFLFYLRQRSVVLWQYLSWRIEHDQSMREANISSNFTPERVAYSWIYFTWFREPTANLIPSHRQNRNLYLGLRDVKRRRITQEEMNLFMEILRKNDIGLYNYALKKFQ